MRYRSAFQTPAGECAVLYQKKGGACREVWVDGIAEDHRDTRGWSGNQIGNLNVIGLDDLCRPYKQFAMDPASD